MPDWRTVVFYALVQTWAARKIVRGYASREGDDG